MHGTGEEHDGGCDAAGYGTCNPFDFFEVGAEAEQLGDGDADERGDCMAEKSIARLAEGRADRVVL